VMLESAQRLEVAPLLKRVAEGLEQARYELRCFRLSKSRL
jgi:hypothetical protein